MINILFYVFLYCNADIILNKLYLSNYSNLINNELIQNNSNFYYAVINLNLFVLTVYSVYSLKNLIYYNSINKVSNALALIYIKYSITSFFSNNMTLSQFEFSRNIMWLFATPLMIKMYCDANNINIHYIYLLFEIYQLCLKT